jgi:hypothetical protein
MKSKHFLTTQGTEIVNQDVQTAILRGFGLGGLCPKARTDRHPGKLLTTAAKICFIPQFAVNSEG